jgi:hypothetical protein
MNFTSNFKKYKKLSGINKYLFVLILNIFTSSFLNAQIDSNSIKGQKENAKLNDNSIFVNDYHISISNNTLDTNEYKLMLKIFYRNQNLFVRSNTYFFISDDAIINELNSVDYNLIFIENNYNKTLEFLNQHSTNILLTDNNISNTNKLILNSGHEVEIKKDFESFMVTDNKTFESIIKGHLTLNSISIFFNHLPFKQN